MDQSCLFLCYCHVVTFSFVKRLFSERVVGILRVPLVTVMLLVAVYKERMLLACVDTQAILFVQPVLQKSLHFLLLFFICGK